MECHGEYLVYCVGVINVVIIVISDDNESVSPLSWCHLISEVSNINNR